MKNISTNRLLALVVALVLTLGIALAADAPKTQEPPKAPAPTVEQLTAENNALKAQLVAVATERDQWKAAAAALEAQRNQALNAAVQKEMANAAQPKTP